MTHSTHQVVRDFFTGMAQGDLVDELFTDDVAIWVLTYGALEKANYVHGVKVLQSLFPNGLAFHIQALIADGDRVAAEVQAKGTLNNGQIYHNFYVFLFRVRDGRIASFAEYYDPLIVQEKLSALFEEAMRVSRG